MFQYYPRRNFARKQPTDWLVDEEKFRELYFYPYLNKDSIFVDAGAAYGNWTVSALNKDIRQVFAFEPDPRILPILYKNTEKFSNCLIINMGLWSSSTNINFEELEHFTVTTLDSFLNESGVDYIKIDVEGAEMEVIQGALETIKKYKPKIFVENHLIQAPRREVEIIDLLMDMEYKYVFKPQDIAIAHSFFY